MLAIWSAVLAAWIAAVAAQETDAGAAAAATDPAAVANPAAAGAAAVSAAGAAAVSGAEVALGVTTEAPAAVPADPLATAAPLPGENIAEDPLVQSVNAGQTAAGASAISDVTREEVDGEKPSTNEEAAAIAEVPAASGEFVEGFIEKYFAKVTLEPGEKQCIEQSCQSVTQAGVGFIETLAQFIGMLAAKQTPNPILGVTGLGQIVQIVTQVQEIIRKCVKEDAVAVMNQTLAHVRNPQYMDGRFVANGIDIAKVLADSIPSYTEGNFRKVGGDFGTLMRKILLSRNSKASEMVLPEGENKAEIGEDVTNGIIAGLFVEGTAVTITSRVDASINVHVDLHQCIAEEAPYFSNAMNALYLSIAQITTNIEQWQLQRKGVSTGFITNAANLPGSSAATAGETRVAGAGILGMDQMGGGEAAAGEENWMGELSGLMGNIPTLMSRCGFTEQQRQMMSDALKSMNTISLAFTIPGPPSRTEAAEMAAIKFKNATAAWKGGEYKWFGFYLGGLMRDLLLTVYPEKYHVDDGQLKSFVDSKRMTTPLSSPAGSFTFFVGGFAAVLLVGLTVVRVVRPRSHAGGTNQLLQAEADLGDMEAHGVCEVE